MNLALFDLDNTLLPIDSDYTWGELQIKLAGMILLLSRLKMISFMPIT
jgi:FMN phosphatase YigB (HAD superfamily)